MHAAGSLNPRRSTSSASLTSRASAAVANSSSSAGPHGRKDARSSRASARKCDDAGTSQYPSSTLALERAARALPVLRRAHQLPSAGAVSRRRSRPGTDRFNAGANGRAGPTSQRSAFDARFPLPRPASIIPGLTTLRSPLTRGGSPVREIRSPGSVRGAARKGRPYRYGTAAPIKTGRRK